MTWLAVKDNAESTLASALGAGVLTATLATGEGAKFPASNFIITICLNDGTNLEKILVDSRSGDVLTINASGRGYGGTSDVFHAAGEKVFIGTIQHPIEEIQSTLDGKFNTSTGHDHDGTDSKQVDHGALGGLADDDHTQYVKHSLATAANDFLIGTVGAWVKKTLAETKTILGHPSGDIVGTTDTQTLSSKTLTKPTVQGSTPNVSSYTPSAGGTATLDLSNSNVHVITMPAGNITIALSNVSVGQIFSIEIIQDSVGSRTVTWFSTIKWTGGSAPTLTMTASKKDVFVFRCTSSGNYDGFIAGQNI
jgi:hypothetical protein